MEKPKVRSLSFGAKQQGMRNFNERLLLSMVQRYGTLPSAKLARLSGLSAQTVSIITRKLIAEGLLEKGKPQPGGVGKPSTPIRLSCDGVYCFGLKIGRRGVEIILMDFCGNVLGRLDHTYPYPLTANVLEFLKDGIDTLSKRLRPKSKARIAGIGIAIPDEFWSWNELVGAPKSEFEKWKDFDFCAEISKFSALPVYHINDATAACRAEHVFGRGREFCDYAYFYVGAFVGGGVVLNHSVYEGNQKNAGAFASIPTSDGDNRLLGSASIYLLETALADSGISPARLWTRPQDWGGFAQQLDHWLEQSANALARACVSVCAVIDFEAILIDGAFSTDIRQRLVNRTNAIFAELDTRGIVAPQIEEGSIGGDARAIGAACGPIFAQYLLNTNSGLPHS